MADKAKKPGTDNFVGKGFDARPQDINREGRPKGARNRNTIAREVLAMEINVPEELYEHYIQMYPNLPKKMSMEMVATLAVMKRALKKGDYLRYKAIMDSAYGAPKQEIDMTSDGERINPVITVINNTGSRTSKSEKDVDLSPPVPKAKK